MKEKLCSFSFAALFYTVPKIALEVSHVTKQDQRFVLMYFTLRQVHFNFQHLKEVEKLTCSHHTAAA